MTDAGSHSRSPDEASGRRPSRTARRGRRTADSSPSAKEGPPAARTGSPGSPSAQRRKEGSRRPHPIETDIVIIGAGPVGLFAVFEAGLLGLASHLVDNLDKIGGQCAELYPEKPIYDIPSRPRLTARELVDDLLRQIEPFHPAFHLSQQAESLERQADGRWRLGTSAGGVFVAPVVVVAAGVGSFVPRRPPLSGIEGFENRSVFYAVRDPEAFRDRRVVVAGGGDSALDWTLELEPLARRLTLVHRRNEFRAAPDTVRRMRDLAAAGKMDLRIGRLAALEGSDGALTAVTVSTEEGGTLAIPCDVLLPFYGLKTELGPVARWGLNFDRNLIEVDTEKFETSEPGVFAIGDVCAYPGKLKLILSGFHEGALMAQQAFRYCRPDEKLVFRYTTTSTELHRRLGVA